MPTCRTCLKEKPADEFYRWRRSCKECVRQASAEFRAHNKDGISKSKRQYYAAMKVKIDGADEGALNAKARNRENARERYRRLAASSPEFVTWTSMKARCHNPQHDNYRNYGGRGINVCPRWRESFKAFLADMGPKPSRSHSIDRFPDPDGDYEPGNCRWATPKEQAQNKRK